MSKQRRFVASALGLFAGLSLTTFSTSATEAGTKEATAPASAPAGNAAGQRFVPDVLGAWVNLSRRADALAARRLDTPAATTCKHHQGLVRKDGPDGTPYLFFTRSGNQLNSVLCDGGDEPGYLFVVRMASRDKNGERLRTNVLPFDLDFDELPNLQVDKVVKVIRLNDTFDWPAYRHPGGMQVVGDVLAMGAEEPYGDHPGSRAAIFFVDVSDPENPTLIKKFEPPDLEPGSGVGCGDIAFGPEHNCAFGADPVGLTAIKAPDGSCCRYLMFVAGGPGNAQIRFYRSKPDPGKQTTDLKSHDLDWDMVGRFALQDFEPCLGAEWPESQGDLIQGGQHQMFSLVREDDLDGQLYLIGGRRDGIIANPLADELLDLYKVNLTAEGIPETCPLTYVRSRQMGDQAWGDFLYTGSFSAGSGVYVSPSGEVIVYRTGHESTDFIVLGEFRALSLVRGDSPTLQPTATVDGPVVVDEGSSVVLNGHGAPAITKAYIQLFDSNDAGTHLNDERWLNIDFADRLEAPFSDLEALGFQDDGDPIFEEANSLRWFAPPGCTIGANDYPTPVNSGGWPGPNTVHLAGTGNFEEVFDLADLPVYTPAGSLWPVSPAPPDLATTVDYRNDIGGVSFFHQVPFGDGVAIRHDCESYYNAAIGLAWDLDCDDTYETSGLAATFSAAQLDGPSVATVNVRAQHPTDTSALGTGAPQTAAIEVLNVAPQLVSATVVDSLGRSLENGAHVALIGLPVNLAIDFTDPGRPDTQTALVTWGDGLSNTAFDTFSDASGGAKGMLRHKHVFTSAGTFPIHAAITDDDGGSTPFDTSVKVLSLEGAMESIADELRDLIAHATDPDVAAALMAALDNLVGNHGGHPPTNGALDKLLANDLVATVTKLRAVIASLILAESRGAGDLTSMKDLLGLIAEGVATTAYERARALIPSPSPGQTRTLRTIADLILHGHAQLAAHQYLAACDDFRLATDKAVKLH